MTLSRSGAGPLAELDTSFARAARSRLEEQRLAALEQRIDADLARAVTGGSSPSWTVRVREHPSGSSSAAS